MTSRLLPLRACSAIVALAAAASLATASRVAGREYVLCYGSPETVTARGAFTEGGSGRQTRLVLARDAERGCVIRHEGSDAADIGRVWTGVYLAGICRDAETGRDHAMMHASAGQHSDIQVWTADPATGSPLMLYSEAWGGHVSPAGREWGLDLLVAADGTCRWRERQDAHKSFKAAMAALRIGAAIDAEEPEFDLPARPVPAGTVRRWLPVLEGAATLEGAVYADDDGRMAWLVVQVLGRTLCDAEGVVLLFDRQRQSWQTIYDVPSGCSKTLNFPMRGMVVKGDRLFASLCRQCNGWGDYRDFVIDLRSLRAAALDPGGGPALPDGHENPVIHELDSGAFPQSAP